MRRAFLLIAVLSLPVVLQAQVATKLAWDQQAASLAAANAQSYYATIDGNTIAMLTATCTGTASPFVCATAFPAVPPGNHSITVNAVAGLLEAASSPFPVSVPYPPTNVRVTR